MQGGECRGRVPDPWTKPSVRVRMGKFVFRALEDTGADVSLLSIKAFRMLQGGMVGPHLNRGTVALKSASGTAIKFKLGTQKYTHEFHVVESITSTITLGWDFLSKMTNDASIGCSTDQGFLSKGTRASSYE